MKVLEAALAATRKGICCAMCTVVGVNGSAPRSGSARMLVYADGSIVGTIGGGAIEQTVIQTATQCIQSGQHQKIVANLSRDLGMCCGGEMEVFVEVLEAQPRAHIFGAGHVGQAVTRCLIPLGFEVHVYDEREEWIEPLSSSDVAVHLGDPEPSELSLTGRDYLLIFTHSHDLDERLLRELIEQEYAYLGLIGSQTKVARFFLRLKAGGMDESLFAKVNAPIGLDIGAETPEEIAVSIAAELVRVRRRHSGPVLAMSEYPIPARGGDGKATPPALGLRKFPETP
mgnify:CR=1 FL=1